MATDPKIDIRFVPGRIDLDRKVLFETLPESLQRNYYKSALVHMHVSAFLYGKIPRDEMFLRLAVALTDENSSLRSTMEDYARWFGAPLTCPFQK